MQKLFIILFLFVPFIGFSQNDSTDSTVFEPHISGSADVYYRYNVNAPQGSANNFTKFTNTQNTFALGMASVKAVDSFKNVSGAVNIGFGPRVNAYNYTEADNSVMIAIKEVYMSYAVSKALKFTAGKWYKHIGYETPDADANLNYSMSYTFSFGPMSYTGIKADIVLAKKINMMVGLTNPADISGTRYSPVKAIIAGVNFNALHNKMNVKLNFQGYGGVSKPFLFEPGYYLFKSLQQYDAVVHYVAGNKWDLAYNGTVQVVRADSSRSWIGNVIYITYKWKPDFNITLRGEHFNDDNFLKLGADVFALTLSANYNIHNRLRIIPEIRLDKSPDHIFQRGNVAGTGTTFTGLLAAVYSFGK